MGRAILNKMSKVAQRIKELRESTLRLSMLLLLILLEVFLYECIIIPFQKTQWAHALYQLKQNPFTFFQIDECVLFFCGVVLFILILILYIWAKHLKYNVGIHASTAVKLLANAISSRYLNLFFLFVFVIHITWLGNSSYNIISQEKNFNNIWVFVLSLLSTIVIIMIFPAPIKTKLSGKTVYFSGISFPLPQSNNPITRWNLLPLVRGLENLQRGDTICILLSDAWINQLAKKSKVENEAGNKMSSPSDFITETFDGKKTGVNYSYNEEALNDYRDSKKEAIPKLADSLTKAIGVFITNYKSDKRPVECLEEVLSKVIKAMVVYEFPEKEDFISEISVEFTPLCDYNNFDSCFQYANEMLERYEEKGDSIVINSTPGTVVTTAVTTLLSLDTERRLLYYKQFFIPVEECIVETKCNDTSLTKLIERVSEKLSNKSN